MSLLILLLMMNDEWLLWPFLPPIFRFVYVAARIYTKDEVMGPKTSFLTQREVVGPELLYSLVFI
jgi:hypothetical protein